MSNVELLAEEYNLTVTDVLNIMDVLGYDIKEYNEQDNHMDIDHDLGNALTDLMFIKWDEETAYYDDDDDGDDDDDEYN